MSRLIADRRLYTDSQRELILEERDTRAAFLLYAAGKPIGEGDVRRFELSEDAHGRVTWPGHRLPEPELPDIDAAIQRRERVHGQLDQLKSRGRALMEELDSLDELIEGGGEEDDEDEGLPDDIPGRDELRAAGFETLEDIAAARDLTEFTGIGKATAAKIVDYLEAAAADES